VETANIKEMINNSAPRMTPKPSLGAVSTQNKDGRVVFMGAVIDMTWQLAIVVLIPIVGGYKLDQHFKTTPLWLLVGCALAIAGTVAVLRRILSGLNQSFTHPGETKK
jgi:F0F1-type ATP synthase assembly protein I